MMAIPPHLLRFGFFCQECVGMIEINDFENETSGRNNRFLLLFYIFIL